MSYTEVETKLLDAWGAVREKLNADPAELARRLERRNCRQFRRPLRAFCLAVRANDHRITDMDAIIIPRHALTLHGPGHEGRYAEHRVILTDDLVKRICDPCHISPPGEPADHVAAKLGCGTRDLRVLRRTGRLMTNPKPGLMGRRGRPVPVIYAREYLDPAAARKRGPDEVFSLAWIYASLDIPDGFRQTVLRAPRYRRIAGRNHFLGWTWICPCCRQDTRNLYYPLPHPDLAVMQAIVPPLRPWGQQHAPVFACYQCHDIVTFSRGRLGPSWNQLVLHYSGGLMYGHEVEKPAWLKARPPKLQRPVPESAKRLNIKRLLVTTAWPYPRIGREVGMAKAAVGMMSRNIYKREGVNGREALREKLAPAYPVQTEARRAG